MIVMRPRFSLRWLMIAFTLSAVAFYVLFVRPTVIANRFVRAIEQGDFKYAESLLGDASGNAFAQPYADATFVAEVSPREWSDIWRLRRTITVGAHAHMKYRQPATSVVPAQSYEQVIWQEAATYESGPFGVRLIAKQGTHLW